MPNKRKQQPAAAEVDTKTDQKASHAASTGGSGGGAAGAAAAAKSKDDPTSLEYAVALDAADPLREMRFQFSIPLRSAIAEYTLADKAAAAAAAAAPPKKHKSNAHTAAAASTAADTKIGLHATATAASSASSTAAAAAAPATAAAAALVPPSLARALSQSDNKSSSDNECIYLCGNSLGLQPKRALEYVMDEMVKWSKLGVEGHFLGKRPWAPIDEEPTELIVPLLGASDSSEVAIMGTLSNNLHLLMVSFYRPKPESKRFKILTEDGAFCSDQHIVRSQIELSGRKVEDALLTIKPRAGEVNLRTDDILKMIELHGESIAVVFFPGVQFYTGQSFDLAAITRAAHAKGAVVGIDLAHAIGNVELKLHDWGVDFASWCSYKYLNSGPGSISGVYLHSRHHSAERAAALPRFAGWWGQTMSTRFKMSGIHQPKAGAQSYMLSNPPVLPTVCLVASLELYAEAGGITALRKKSIQLTNYLDSLLRTELGSLWGTTVTLLTPTDSAARGCQLSLLLSRPVRPINERLASEYGVICDIREPNVIRVAPTPLYNTFVDCYRFVQAFKRVITTAE